VSNDGQNILKLVKQMRKLCEQVAMLLRTVDEQMSKAGWNTESNYALSELSYSILNPTQWIPINAFQFYRHKDYSNRLAYVSALLDDHWDREYTTAEPLVTAGFLDYGQVKISDDENWYARYYGHLSKDHNLKADGQPFHFDKAMLPPNLQGKFENGKVFAVPLVPITNADDVRSQITSKLLNLLKDEK
jgi:hypothetical protein